MEIEQERFEAWALSLSPDTKFDYYDCDGCAIASFLQQTTSWSNARVNGTHYRRDKFDTRAQFPIPKWLYGLVEYLPSQFTAGELQARYRELFPDTTPELTPAIAEAVRK